ncbi:MAG TPA: CPBP family intramembrane glutamic endopeptidase [Halanaerobiales bacterium]|nr:CPBP family intramembrane glutamic endopeptidase [Halanaerobiales bacterium]
MPSYGIPTGITNLILFLIVVIARRLISKEGISSFLISRPKKRWKLFFEGGLVGFILILVYVFMTILFGVGELSFNINITTDYIFILLSYLFGFAAVAIFEESLFRDYLLLKIKSKYSATEAVFLSSLLFGLVHIISYITIGTIAVLGLFNAFLIGVLLSIIVIATHSILWALGFHLVWNLTQTMFLVPKQGGIELKIEKGILAGTELVPEAGIIVTLVLIILAIYMLNRFDCAHIMPKSIGKG